MFKDVPKKGTAFLCLADNEDEKILLTFNDRKVLDNGDIKKPGWGMPGGGVIDWQSWASDDPTINEKIIAFKSGIPNECETFLEGMLREAFEEGNVFFLYDKKMLMSIIQVIQGLFKTFDVTNVMSLWKEKILLFHEYALRVKELDLFELAFPPEPEKTDEKTGKMRGQVHIFKLKEGKVNFSTLAEASAINDIAQTVSKSEWWPLESVREIAFKKSHGIKFPIGDNIYSNHIVRLQKAGVIGQRGR